MSTNKKPYGTVPYADPGHQSDGVARYPIDTKAHAKAAWSYINMPKNEKGYSAEQLSGIKAKIKTALTKFGVQVGEENSEFVDLAYRGVPAFGPERRSFAAQFETRSLGNGRIELTGYASTVEQPYRMYDMFGEYSEVVRAGAFAGTLANNADVSFLANHTGLTMARTRNGSLKLSEDSTGLLTVAELDDRRSDARDLLAAIERGDVDEMSFGFRVKQQKWSPDYDERALIELDLDRGDVSAVNFGANPNTSISAGMRAFDSADAARIHALSTELRSAGPLSDEARSAISRVLDLAAGDQQARSAIVEPEPVKPAEILDNSGGFVPMNKHMLKRYHKSLKTA